MLGLGLGVAGCAVLSQAPAIAVDSGTGLAGSVYRATRAGQWTADGQPIAGATGTTWVMTPAHEGAAIRCGASNAIEIWVPSDLPGILGWWDARRGVTLAGGTVSAWAAVGGSPVAVQPIGSRQPALARHPAGGRRNLYPRTTFDWAPAGPVAANLTSADGGLRIDSGGASGLTTTVVATGILGGLPWIDYRVQGTNTSGTGQYLDIQYPGNLPVTPGQPFQWSAWLQVVDGSTAGLQIWANAVFRDAASAVVGVTWDQGGSNNLTAVSGVMARHVRSTVLPANAVTVTMPGVFFSVPAGAGVDCTLRVMGMQIEQAAAGATAAQVCAGIHDCTEAGRPDIWHLVRDGVDDTLDLTLPAGTWTRALADSLGAVTFTEGIAAGPEDVLRVPRLADILHVDRVLTQTERNQLTSYWQARMT
ncbi:MAG: hypothetical protein IT542_05015 [Rubellimicrobium sp.]|nr:hypothetical protein [Rubellimicrobium sp.]